MTIRYDTLGEEQTEGIDGTMINYCCGLMNENESILRNELSKRGGDREKGK